VVSTGDLMLPGPDALQAGECYFDISFHEDDDRYPCIETWVYVGTKTVPARRNRPATAEYYFQSVESYLTNGDLLQRPASRWPKKNGVAVMNGDVVTGMFDLDGLAKALSRLARAQPK
jgi:hypothetical protein